MLLPKLINRQSVRFINYDTLSNKRITRLQSDVELDGKDLHIKPRLINRNPRNLELMSFDRKPHGFWLDRNPNTGYNKLEFVSHGKYLYATLRHWSGDVVLQASTKEPALKKYFTSPGSEQATVILARVVARRCLQSGYIQVTREGVEFTSPKGSIFYDNVTKNGLCLEESPQIVPRSITDI